MLQMISVYAIHYGLLINMILYDRLFSLSIILTLIFLLAKMYRKSTILILC